jgi:CheY-like chemotaxis protein
VSLFYQPTVLLALNSPNTAARLRSLLQSAGYRAEDAHSGDHVLSLLRTSEWPLVVVLELMASSRDVTHVLHAAAQNVALAARHAFIVLTAGTTAHELPPLDVATYRSQLHGMCLPEPLSDEHVRAGVAWALRQVLDAAWTLHEPSHRQPYPYRRFQNGCSDVERKLTWSAVLAQSGASAMTSGVWLIVGIRCAPHGARRHFQ